MNRTLSCLIITIFFFQAFVYAQFTNKGSMIVKDNGVLSSMFVFENIGEFYNNGNFLLSNNFINEGYLDYSTGTVSKLILEGDISIGGTGMYILKNVSFNGNIEIQKSLHIEGYADFIEGIVYPSLPRNTLLFNEYSSASAHSNSYFKGPIFKTGYQDFISPIGKDVYAPVKISSISDKFNSYRVEYYSKPTEEICNHTRREDIITIIDPYEYWEITDLSSTENGQAILKINFTENTISAIKNFNPEIENLNVRLLHYNFERDRWEVIESEVEDFQNFASGWIEKNGIYTFGLVRTKGKQNENDVIVFNGMSLNEDGRNEFFEIKGLDKYEHNELFIYNRWGQEIFHTRNYSKNNNWWYGNYKNEKVTGTMFYVLTYWNNDLGSNREIKKGFIHITK